MSADRWQDVSRIYHAALERDRAVRPAFLLEACAGDEGLRREIESLLAYDPSTGGMLSAPALDLAARMMANDHGLDTRVGRRHGRYEIVARIGAGGMGDVYRARDRTLRRDVALKMLPPMFSRDPQHRARFEREARLLAALNHSHIGAIYGVEEDEADAGTLALVLELVEGDTLADRIARGPLPLVDTLSIAMQMADALDAAHDKGIVHRDLKPANIKITPAGAVKVLDFGIAKAVDAGAQDTPGDAPTLTATSTGEGAIVGTARYMSPEQARGQAIDKRTDIWAFGCVLFEMVTGHPTFGAPTFSESIAAVLHRDPDWRLLPATTPIHLRRLIERCLDKDPKQRLRDIGEARIALDRGDRQEPHAGDPPTRRPTSRLRLAVAILGASALVAAAVIVMPWLRPESRPSSPPVRFIIAPPPDHVFGASLGPGGGAANVETSALALSPDGSRLAFVATERSGHRQIWLRPFSELEARPIPSTEGATTVFWSPDGASIGFVADNQLKRLDLGSRAAITLCEVTPGGRYQGSWGRDSILFASGGRLMRVSTAGGSPSIQMEANATANESQVGWPWFLPDGERFLYLVRFRNRDGEIRLAQPGKPPVVVAAAISNAQWVDPNYVVYARDGTLIAQAVDLATWRAVGEPVPLAERVQHSRSTARTTFATSRNGTLVYQGHQDLAQLVWFDRRGQEMGRFDPQGDYLTLRVSATRPRAMFARADPRLGSFDLWLLDLDRGTENRVTFEPTSEYGGLWIPGRNAVVFAAERDGPPHLFTKDLDTGAEVELTPAEGLQVPMDVSPDGRMVLFTQPSPQGGRIATVPVDGKQPPTPPVATSAADLRYSPDGKFLSLVSNHAGRADVYVAPRSAPLVMTPVSMGGASNPRWSRTGGELFYASADGHVMTARIRTSPSLHIDRPEPLFKMGGRWPWRDFELSPDGQRFLAVVPQSMASEQPLTVVQHWTSTPRR